MKRAAFLLLVPALIVLSGATPSFAQGLQEPGVISLDFTPRPAGNDEIVMCSDHDFPSINEALAFAHALAPKLGFGPGSINYDTVDYKDCVRLTPDAGLTRPGPRKHERIFSFDPMPVFDEAKREFHFTVLALTVCVPSLPATVSPLPQQSIGGACEHPFDHEDDWTSDEFGSLRPIEVRFRATPESLIFGILGDAAFWGLVAAILFFLALRQSRKQWRFFIKHRFWAWILNVALMLVLVFGAIEIGPYWSSWIQSLQLYVHLGVPGEGFLVAIPALALCAVMVVGPIRAGRSNRGPRDAARGSPSLATADSSAAPIPRLAEGWGSRAFVYFILNGTPFVAFVVLTNNISIGRGGQIALLALAGVFLLGDWFWRALRRWIAGSREATSKMTLVRSDLGGLGVHISRAFVSETLLFGDVSSPAPGRLTPVLLEGRDVVVWRVIESQPSAVLTGAAIDSIGLNSEWMVVPFLLAVLLFNLTLPETAHHHISPSVVSGAAVVGFIFLVRSSRALFRRRRLIREAAQSPRAAYYLRGMLLRRWIAARRVASKRPARWRFLSRAQPASQIWRGAMRSAARFAEQARIPRDVWQRVVQEVMATDLG